MGSVWVPPKPHVGAEMEVKLHKGLHEYSSADIYTEHRKRWPPEVKLRGYKYWKEENLSCWLSCVLHCLPQTLISPLKTDIPVGRHTTLEEKSFLILLCNQRIRFSFVQNTHTFFTNLSRKKFIYASALTLWSFRDGRNMWLQMQSIVWIHFMFWTRERKFKAFLERKKATFPQLQVKDFYD